MAETCPKCDYAGVEADTCPRCRVIVSQYRAYLLRRREKRFRALVRGIRDSTLYWVVLFIIVLGANVYILSSSAPPRFLTRAQLERREEWEPAVRERRVQWFWAAVMGCGAAVVVQNGTFAFVSCSSTIVANQWGEKYPLEITASNIINGEAGVVEVVGPLVFGVCTGVITRRRWRAYRGINPLSGPPIQDDVFLLVVYGLLPFLIISAAIGPVRVLGLVLFAGAGLFMFALSRAWKRGELYFHARETGGLSEKWGRWRLAAGTPFLSERVLRRQEQPLAFYLWFSLLVLLALGLLVGASIVIVLNPPYSPWVPRLNLPG